TFEDVTEQAGLKVDWPAFGKVGPWSEGQKNNSGLAMKTAAVHMVDMDNNGTRDMLLGILHENEEGKLAPVVFRNTGVKNGVPQFVGPPTSSMIGYYATAPLADYDRDGRMAVFPASWFHQID